MLRNHLRASKSLWEPTDTLCRLMEIMLVLIALALLFYIVLEA